MPSSPQRTYPPRSDRTQTANHSRWRDRSRGTRAKNRKKHLIRRSPSNRADPQGIALTATPLPAGQRNSGPFRNDRHSTKLTSARFVLFCRATRPFSGPPCYSETRKVFMIPATASPSRRAGLAYLLGILRKRLLTRRSETPSKKRRGGRESIWTGQ